MTSATMERVELMVDGTPVGISNPDKLLWPQKPISKVQYLEYLIQVAPYMLPHVMDRVLTVIRFPDGVTKEKFYQKHCPSYAPDFVQTYLVEDIRYILCNDLATLIWLGNQASIELHVPFVTIHSTKPQEIVFDLDPPSQKEFALAVHAALMMKEIFDQLKLVSFVKTSGNKGLQVYIPLPKEQYTFEETRSFTKFVADYLTAREPSLFTTERLKKNRANRLYLDYVQHAEGKTIIAPYSARGNEDALIATPLIWQEVNEKLRPHDFTLEMLPRRIQQNGCPFAQMEESRSRQNFDYCLEWISKQKTS
ncbi:non-homologous end-joining DNA ligase [Brevibacillus ginsengisoli]|uniref:non-homologous end-joining DNA ligase n=1 Tax=Brevibacillus ginsengisoli TaxID=363854 RepID=UPI003CEFB8C6